MDKEKINKNIDNLNQVLEHLKVLDQDNETVKENTKAINNQITILKLKLTEVDKYIPLKDRIFRNLFTSKIIAINVLWLTCEFLNSFTEVFASSNNHFIVILRTVVPGLTVFLRSVK